MTQKSDHSKVSCPHFTASSPGSYTKSHANAALRTLLVCTVLSLNPALSFAQSSLPVVTIASDNTIIDKSCIIRISPGVAIPDRDGNGVIQVTQGGITIEFEARTVLQGNYAGKAAILPEQLTGTGISIINPQGGPITVKNARIEGYKVGIHAVQCDSLTIDGGNIRNNFRQRLRSKPIREDASDWLWPHANDNQEWRKSYGAAVCVENSTSVTISNLTVRHTQNGIILDRVNQSQIFDNDCSFLSGWGLAMWRSSRNMVSRNSFDFCIRGHVEGVYNRGQDSAGILVFEQCSGNIFAENSATHSGDGFFGFAGKEAIGELPPQSATTAGEEPTPFDYAAAGCNDNLLVSNDFSYASAHGIEMTFSRRNRFIHNTMIENAICGIWGGYSNDTIISRNHFARNGGMAYGLERGAINIEHGSGNIIHNNTFLNNRCGIHLWWDADTKLLEMPGVKANYRGVTDNVITSNRIEINADHPFNKLASGKSSSLPLIGLHLRDKGIDHVKGTLYMDNTIIMTAPDAVELLADEGISVVREGKLPEIYEEPRTFPGERTAFGLRKSLAGRHNIILDEYGPWDHESPFVVPVSTSGSVHIFDVFGVSPQEWKDVKLSISNARAMVNLLDTVKPSRHRIEVRTLGKAEEERVASYTLNLQGKGFEFNRSGTIFANTWECAAFGYSADPRTEEDKWRTDRMRTPQAAVTVPWVDFDFGRKGPKGLQQFAEQKDIAPGPDRFGVICVSTFMLPKGTWRFSTLSDDGVRVLVKKVVEGRLQTSVVLENWTHHAPTQDSGLFHQEKDGEVSVNVEYFQLDGHAVLKLEIQRED